MAETKEGIETAERDEEERRKKFTLTNIPENGEDGEVQYRAVILNGFSETETTVVMRSEWLCDKEIAEQIVNSHRPFLDGWGGVFDGYVERKEQL